MKEEATIYWHSEIIRTFYKCYLCNAQYTGTNYVYFLMSLHSVNKFPLFIVTCVLLLLTFL